MEELWKEIEQAKSLTNGDRQAIIKAFKKANNNVLPVPKPKYKYQMKKRPMSEWQMQLIEYRDNYPHDPPPIMGKNMSLEREKKYVRNNIRRRLEKTIGDPSDLSIMISTILDQPGGRRMKARQAVHPDFRTDAITKSGLCKDLNDEMYKSELFELAKELELPATQSMRKKELCELLSDYVMQMN